MTLRLRIEDLVVEGRKPSGEWVRIVQGVSVDVEPGTVVALIGESGAGKTTVALSALGYSRPGTRIIRGHVYLGETDILSLSQEQRRKIRGKQLAYIAQSAAAALNPAIRLGEQVAEALLVHRAEKGVDSVHDYIVGLLELLDLPDPARIARRYPHQVSGGQQQRVMVAMAMACMPEFLVLDEPTTALDVTTQIEVLKAVKDVIREKKSSAIYVSHDLAVVAQVADWIVVMYDGRVLEKGRTQEILSRPREKYTRELLRAVRLVPGDSGEFAKRERRKTNGDGHLLKLKSIYASYGKGSWLHSVPKERQVLRGVDLSVDSGKVVALVGESGSGKSTIARVIAGLLRPTSGQVLFRDSHLSSRLPGRPLDQLRRIQMVCQSPDTTLNPAQSIEEAVGRPLGLYFGLGGNTRRDRIRELLTMVGLPPEYLDRYPSELSGGERQRASLARAFAAEPDLVLCDEVLSALDTVVGAAVLDLVRDLQQRLGVAYLFISHDLATVATIANRVIVLYAGRVCEEGETDEVFSPPYHPYTALLMSSVPELRCGWLEDVLLSRATAKGIVHGGVAPMDFGCGFRNRCPLFIQDLCDRQPPTEKKIAERHTIYCHRDIDELLRVQGQQTPQRG